MCERFSRVLVFLLLLPIAVSADVVTETSAKTVAIVMSARLSTPEGNRIVATTQTAVFEAVNAVTRRYPVGRSGLKPVSGASVEAAVAAATRTVLMRMLPSQKEAIEVNYHQALASIAEGEPKSAGIRLGEEAAATVLELRKDDSSEVAETFRPITQPGVYVPTAMPVFSTWTKRKPWVLERADQFRPGPPPELKSEIWARDFNEIKSMGVKKGSKRTPEQTAVASFWETTGTGVYWPIVLSVANSKNREVTQNARLLAIVGQATDDAVIAVFDAKYTYNFWRPVTAIRNGDIDGNDATERDPSWTPFIDTPMHPEYPCAHCIIASTIGTVLKADLGETPIPELSSASPTLAGATRRWTSVDDFIREVSEARICDGVHYRTSTEVGTAMGKKIGELVYSKFPPK
jgi:hypothetical protein